MVATLPAYMQACLLMYVSAQAYALVMAKHSCVCRLLAAAIYRGIWRNGLMFSPSSIYGEYSYKQIMLDPLARALNRALAQTAAENKLWPRQDLTRPVVYMALQGEWQQRCQQHCMWTNCI